MTGEPSVAVIGLGARGLGVLERLVSLCRDLGADRGRLCVEVIDPTCSGRGIHVREQPNYLRLHSPAGKVTMFPDAATLPGTGAGTGPSLLDWAVDRGLTVGPDGLPAGRRAAGHA